MLVDAHLDLAWNALAEGRGFDGPPARGYLVTRRSLIEAGVGLAFATLYCRPFGARSDRAPFSYRTSREAHLMARAQVGYYRAVGLPLVRTRAELDRHVRGWRAGRLAAVLLMEGADPIEEPAQVEVWKELGVRIVGPAWSGTRYAGGTGAPGGLTGLGFELLREMERHGLLLDLSHLAEQAVRDALDVWRGPLLASHSNAQALVPGDRQLADGTLREIGDRGGVVGVNFFARFLRTDGRPARLDDVVRHVRHLARATGGTEHVGLGTDLDGGFPAASAAIRRLSRLGELGPRLRRHFGAAQVEGILGGNWLEFLGRSLPA
ncbi:MAG: membrane dipeptidase [Candidatus Dormibacteraeota bacterium]|nr:membrane dipeptidase [Candidatus Dormibacteraeota bacterium]MBO0761854.1 membrane dipeptidase [Candidatus Dormibacteraeota bacterium]